MAVKDWFPTGRNNSQGWRLDIVSLLAVIGENSVAEHAQPLTASWLCVLPRLIPAPQALLKSNRPLGLPTTSAIVVGVHSGLRVDSLNYFGDLLHNIEEVKRYEFKQFRVTWTEKAEKQQVERQQRQQEKRDRTSAKLDAEAGGQTNGTTSVKAMQEDLDGPRMIGPHRFSPLRLISITSFVATWALFIWAACIKDAVACLSIFTVSFAATLGCAGQFWRPKLAERPSTAEVPAGDVVIRTRKGGFIVVQCKEEIARELYVASEECDYYINDANLFKAMSGVGVFLFMIGVVLLGNCNWTMQAAIGVLFILLNGAYWTASLAEKRRFWDLTRFDKQDITPPHLSDGHKEKPMGPGRENDKPNFTRTLWYAIQATRENKWVAQSGAAPATEAWKEWLRLAYENRNNKDWDAVEAKNRLMKEAAKKDKDDPKEAFRGQAAEQAPQIIPSAPRRSGTL